MIHYTCDLCGKALLANEDTRYVVEIKVYAAYDPMEVTAEELEEDRDEDIQDLLDQLEDADAEEIENDVYQRFRLDLCPDCREAYVKDPLARRVRSRLRFERN